MKRSQAEDLRIALEEEREVTARKYASLEIEASRKEKERKKEFEKELAETIQSFERQSKAFIETIEDKALKSKLDKERAARKAELNRAVISKIGTQTQPQKSASTPTAELKTLNTKIEVGSRVLTSFGNVGTVEKIDKETAEVSIGAMRLREKLANLKAVAEPEIPKQQTLGEQLQAQAASSNLRLDTEDMNSELNLIGKTTAEAEYEIDRFLDEAYLASLPRVRIIHGFGTGALKNFVHHFLKDHPHVSKYGFAPQDQGGNGATIAELK